MLDILYPAYETLTCMIIFKEFLTLNEQNVYIKEIQEAGRKTKKNLKMIDESEILYSVVAGLCLIILTFVYESLIVEIVMRRACRMQKTTTPISIRLQEKSRKDTT